MAKICRKKLHYFEGIRCPECRKASRAPSCPIYQKAYRQQNKEALRQYFKEYDANRALERVAISATRYENNRPSALLYAAMYRKNNVAKRNHWSAKRRASIIERTPKWLSPEQLQQIKQFYIDAKDLQWLSDPTDVLSVDHIIPLNGKIVSGLHVPWNLQILPKSLNSKKRNKFK